MKKINIYLCMAVISALLFVTGCASSKTVAAPAEEDKTVVKVLPWLDENVPSLYETYSSDFEYVGLAASNMQLQSALTLKGLAKHLNNITLENEFKPQFVLAWWNNKPSVSGTFTASNGVTIETPAINGFGNMDRILRMCQKNNLKIRGHVLVWHSQTDAAFFKENYDPAKPLVDKETMTARQEWYIKTVLEHVDQWEKANNDGKHIVWGWDVINETVADGSSNLRNQGSNWFAIYKNNEFIINSFRFANKYAPADVKLAYNDYGYSDATKLAGIINVIKAVQQAQNDEILPTRIDAAGLQTHISVYTPMVNYENALKKVQELGLDIHVTELDIATESKYNPEQLAITYGNYFDLFQKYKKTPEKNGIVSVTLWGINDEATWLNSADQMRWHGNTTQYPLLFELKGNSIVTKQAFWSVIEAAD